MLTVDTAPQLDTTGLQLQEEPALEIALPRVFEQPTLTVLQRGKLPHVEALVARIPHAALNPAGGLGLDYQTLVNEFQPLFEWTMSCWDFLLSTEGCRFVARRHEGRPGIRGDYRVVTYKDFSRLVHGLFRRCVMEFSREVEAPSLREWLRARFWPQILDAYRQLAHPSDPRQRTLTPYSYLRCVPYQFLNDFHHVMVYATVRRLPTASREAIDPYFFHFYTETASAQTCGRSVEEWRTVLHQGLIRLLIHDRLAYCLLRQIERY